MDNIVLYDGVPIEELSREELIRAVREIIKERDDAFSSHQDSLGIFRAAIRRYEKIG